MVAPDDITGAVWAAPGEPGTLWRRRGPAITAHYLACPAVRFQLYLAYQDGLPSGGFLLSFVNCVARIADLWVTNPNEERYERVYRLAIAASYEDGQVAELTTYASIPSRVAALLRCGFQDCLRDHLMVSSRDGLPTEAFDCQMLDNDAAFLQGPRPTFLT